MNNELQQIKDELENMHKIVSNAFNYQFSHAMEYVFRIAVLEDSALNSKDEKVMRNLKIARLNFTFITSYIDDSIKKEYTPSNIRKAYASYKAGLFGVQCIEKIINIDIDNIDDESILIPQCKSNLQRMHNEYDDLCNGDKFAFLSIFDKAVKQFENDTNKEEK